MSSKVSFKYELLIRFKQLEVFDEEPIKELDRDIAEQYYLSNRLPFPGQSALKKAKDVQPQTPPTFEEDNTQMSKENQQRPTTATRGKKTVKFAQSRPDEDDGSWQNQEIKKLEARITELLVINEDLS